MTATILIVVKLAIFEDRNPYVWGVAFGCVQVVSFLALDWWWVLRVALCLAGAFVAMFVANLVKPVD